MVRLHHHHHDHHNHDHHDREERRRTAKHRREREGRHRGWNLIREKYNITRNREQEEADDSGGEHGSDILETEEKDLRYMAEAKTQTFERIEDATSLMSDLLRF